MPNLTNIPYPTKKLPIRRDSILERILSIIAMFVIFVLTLTLAIETTAREEYSGSLNVLNWTSYVPDDVIRDFEEEYGIKVNYTTYSSNEELLAKVSSSAPGTYDVIFPSDYMVSLMIYRDMLEPLDTTRLSHLDNINPVLLHQPYDADNTYSLPFLLATTLIAYDSELYPDITSYRDLFDDRLQNSLILLDDQRVIIGSMLATLGYDFNDISQDHLDDSLTLFDTLRPNIKAFDSDSPKTFLITGEADAGIIWNAEAILAREDRPSIATVYPEEGFVISMDNYCITRGARNLDNAYLFIDYLLRDDIAERIIAEYPYITSNRNVPQAASDDLDTILSHGTYIENVGSDIKKFDRTWSRYK